MHIDEQHIKLTASVSWNGVIGNAFRIHCGVRQCDILSPLLFSVYCESKSGPRNFVA